MRIDWKSLKTFIDNTGLVKFLNYIEIPSNYYTWLFYEGQSFEVMLQKGTADCQDFIDNYMPNSILKNDITDDGVRQTKTMFVGKSRMMHCLFTKFTSSIAETNDTSGFITIRLRDEHHQITTQSENAVYTELDFCPGLIEYGLYGGGLEPLDPVETELYCNALLAPDIPESYGGQIYFVRNCLLKEKVFRSAINVGEIPCIQNFNIMRISLKHDKGLQKQFQSEIQYYI